jgi:hypothetical protein
VTRCSACGTTSTGRFCSNCGAPFAGATCAACHASLSPGARFCHRCGTPAGQSGRGDQRSFSSALPWGVAAIALVALVALVAGQRFGRARAEAASPPPAPVAAEGATRAPDISNLSPADAAMRLYDRVMGAHERGRADTVQLFAPMAIAAYEMIGQLDADQHYDLGRIAAVSGDVDRAKAEADSILAKQPTHLLGLLLAENAAQLRNDSAGAKRYHDRFVAAEPAERAKRLPEYSTHAADITIALNAKRP